MGRGVRENLLVFLSLPPYISHFRGSVEIFGIICPGPASFFIQYGS